ncbi:MAG: hypothetical protein IIA81_07450 [Thaumarchaeota archaeon]|nr:hypothetical protein [Nitrososphaerota archaeon]
MKKYLLLIIFLAIIQSSNIFAVQSYDLIIDENSFELKYELNGDVIAMALDQELTSLLIGIDKTKDSTFTIELPNEMIRSEDNAFAVLVNGLEVDYEIVSDNDSSALEFFVPSGTEEIEIIGTYVIPEFPLGFVLIFGAIMTVVCLMTRHSGRDFI